jgi:polar amino acid transport system substrate-binding protein/two-component system sensor histidine kinase EvgS
MMNGSIKFHSEQGKGTTFTVNFADQQYVDKHDEETSVTINPDEIIFEKSIILVVDDVDENRRLIIDALRSHNISFLEASDGAIAYEIALSSHPNLIIADLRMPVMDGFELLEKIRANEFLKNIPVIAYSASVMNDQKERIHKSNFSGLLIKPVQIKELYLVLLNYLPFKKTASSATPLEEPGFDISEIQDIQGLVISLRKDFYDRWKSFRVRQPIGEIMIFGKELAKLGEKHKSSSLKKYGEDIGNAAGQFNIEKLLNLLDHFKEIACKIDPEFTF